MCDEAEEVGISQDAVPLEITLLEKCAEELRLYEKTLRHVLGSSTMGEKESHPFWQRHLEVQRFNKELTACLKIFTAFQH